MTNDHIHDIDDLHDPLEEQDQEAQLHYSNVRGSEDDRKGGRAAPMPMAGAAGAPAPGAAPMSMGNPTAAAAGGGGGAMLGASGVTAAGAEAADMGAGDLVAAGPKADDPWGAYDNPDNIPGASLDDEQSGAWAAGGMAVRGSGTRGGSKKDASQNRMGPMGPMGGAGAGGAGGVGAGGGAGGAAGGAVGAGAAGVPGATVGGIGSGSALAAQQTGAYGAVVQSTQQGNLSMQAMSSLGGVRATGAMYSPPSSGVMAAGGPLHTGDSDLGSALHRLGVDSSDPYITGPDGNVYANPFHGIDPVTGSGGTPGVRGGVSSGGVSPVDSSRWQTADPGVSGGIEAPSGGRGNTIQDLIALANDVRDTVDRLNGDRYEQQAGGGTSGATSSGTNGVQQSVDGLNSSDYRDGVGTSGSPAGSGGSGITKSTSGGDYVTARTDSVQKMSGHGTAVGSDYSVRGSELQAEARTWDEVSQAQAELSSTISSLLQANAIFGVLEPMVSPYDQTASASATVTRQRSERSDYTSTSMRDSAARYDQHEEESANLLEGMND